jgi:hypothetical protein
MRLWVQTPILQERGRGKDDLISITLSFVPSAPPCSWSMPGHTNLKAFPFGICFAWKVLPPDISHLLQVFTQKFLSQWWFPCLQPRLTTFPMLFLLVLITIWHTTYFHLCNLLMICFLPMRNFYLFPVPNLQHPEQCLAHGRCLIIYADGMYKMYDMGTNCHRNWGTKNRTGRRGSWLR